MNAPLKSGQFIVEIEQELLGALLTGGDVKRVSSRLRPEHFLDPLNRALFETCLTASERYGSANPPVVMKLLDADTVRAFERDSRISVSGYVASLASNAVFGAAGMDTAAKRIVEQWARISMRDELERLYTAACDPSTDPLVMASLAGQVFDDILTDVRHGPARKSRLSVSDAAGNAISAAREARQRGSGLTGITWGLTDINRATGGIQRRDLTLIGARPSMGKTSLALSVALKAARSGHGVGLVSLEMDADKIGARAISSIAFDWSVAIPYQDIIRGVVEEGALEHLERAASDFDGMPFWIEDQAGLSMADIRVKTESLLDTAAKAGHGLSVLMIDHLGLIRAANRYAGNRANEIAEMTAALKSMAREYDIAIVLLSQLNRALESRDDKRPAMSDLRDSGAIEQDADMIAFLYRHAYYLERQKGKTHEAEQDRIERLIDCQNSLEFIIAKQRNGPLRTIDLFANMACCAVGNGAR